jgi:hypothetical protein
VIVIVRAIVTLLVVLLPSLALAQQRPLVTEDPETIGAGNILLEGGFDLLQDVDYPVSGLSGNLLRVPTLGVSLGISSIAELQIDGGFYNRLAIQSRDVTAPLAGMLDVTGDDTSDLEDIVVATKIRVLSETAARPAIGVRLATKLPTAGNESGLGLDTTDFLASVLLAKTVQSVRFVGNAGLGNLADPLSGNRQNDVLTYGMSIARAVREGLEVVGEINGRWSTRDEDNTPIGTDSRGTATIGGRFTARTVRVDAGLIIGVTADDPGIGFTAGFTWVFRGFRVP